MKKGGLWAHSLNDMQEDFMMKKTKIISATIIIAVSIAALVMMNAVFFLGKYLLRDNVVLKDSVTGNKLILCYPGFGSGVYEQDKIKALFGDPDSVYYDKSDYYEKYKIKTISYFYDNTEFIFTPIDGTDTNKDDYLLKHVSIKGNRFSVNGIKQGSSRAKVVWAFLFNELPSYVEEKGNEYFAGPVFSASNTQLKYDQNKRVNEIEAELLIP